MGVVCALAQGLEGDKHQATVGAGPPGEAGDVLHRGIGANDTHKILQLAAHRLERNALIGLDEAHQAPGILLRKEGLGDGDVEPDVESDYRQ